MCSGLMRSSSSSESPQLAAVWCGRPAIKSRLTFANPAARSTSAARIKSPATMHPSRCLQFTIMKGLRAQADAIDPRSAPCLGLLCADVFRVGLHRHFPPIARKAFPHGIHQFRQIRRFQQAGSSASQIDRIHRVSAAGPRLCVKPLQSRISRSTAPHMANTGCSPKLPYGNCNRCTWSGKTAPECRCPGSWECRRTNLLSGTILTRISRLRGPSNSQKKIPCQRPSSSCHLRSTRSPTDQPAPS